MQIANPDSYETRGTLAVEGRTYALYRLDALERAGFSGIPRLPFAIKILLENLLRCEDGRSVSWQDIAALASWAPGSPRDREIAFRPARVLLQDFTGVPAVVDLAAMRDAMAALGGDPKAINPLQPVELVIDHSVQVDRFGASDALAVNGRLEFARNRERYAFLKWGQAALRGLRVVPPDTGICHQVNIEYLARVVFGADAPAEQAQPLAYPDTVVGTDSHTTMVNGIGVVGWGVGGIEAEAAMLGQPITMLVPEVLGVRLRGRLREGVTATDLVLTIAERLRKRGVVGTFVEFFGPGLESLGVADRATIGNMSPEYGSTVALFPIDRQTLAYLELTGRPRAQIALVEAYARAQGLFRAPGDPEPLYDDVLDFDLEAVVPSIAGPRRPQDRVALGDVPREFAVALGDWQRARAERQNGRSGEFALARLEGEGGGGTAVAARPETELSDGAVVIAAITSCTNTSNPAVMLAAGLLAKKAVERGLARKPWVKTSLAPGSQVVTDYLAAAGLQTYLDLLGFNLVGYGCTTCIGNSGPLPREVAEAVAEHDLAVAAVLSGNRNFEGRIHPQVRANYLASPPLVVAYALGGRIDLDLEREPLGNDTEGKPVYLRELWPSGAEIDAAIASSVHADAFRARYADVFAGDERWSALEVPASDRYAWDAGSEYVKQPPYFEGMKLAPEPLQDIAGARALAVLGDSVTTDHISPAGTIARKSPAAAYLIERGVEPADFNSYGARRGNHEVMVRGTFANTRLRNALVPGIEGGMTRLLPGGEVLSIFDAAMRYAEQGAPLIVLAGKEYGSGSSRDWAAKGPLLLGVRAVIAESFERIHRSNLVGMGIAPLEYADGATRASLVLTGEELYEIGGIAAGIEPRARIEVTATRADGAVVRFATILRIDTPDEAEYFRNGGILPFVLRRLRATA
ncbi:MAG: aconitate hydratase AcnA [Vulcanimicrobiaceae bacterium]